MHAGVHTRLSKIGRMNESKKTNQTEQAITDGAFGLVSILDELNRRYKVVKTPTKEDEKKEQGDEAAQ